MQPILPRAACIAALLVALAGCASVPRDHGVARVDALVTERTGNAATPRLQPLVDDTGDTGAAVDALLAQPLDAAAALRVAALRSPRLRQAYAHLGIAQADVIEATRLPNPRLGFARLDADGGGAQITRSLSLGLSELLMLPARTRLSTQAFAQAEREVADALLALAFDVESAWYEHVAAKQVAAMRAAVARAAEASATLAQRLHDAGNLGELELSVERAAATTARIDAVRAAAEATRSRARLAAVLGISSAGDWDTTAQLPAPPETVPGTATLADLAATQRLDLAALREEVAMREQALSLVRRWRFVGDVELGYERESEPDGERLDGPSIELGLPIFQQGQAAIRRAEAELADAQARRDAAVLAAGDDVRVAVDALSAAHRVAADYRDALVPARETIVARTQEEVNYMLRGVFELIRARQDEYDAYQEYLGAVRDYWLARIALRRAVGGRLPDDGVAPEPTLGVDAILSPPGGGGHEHHDASHGDASSDDARSDDTHEHHHHGDTP